MIFRLLLIPFVLILPACSSDSSSTETICQHESCGAGGDQTETAEPETPTSVTIQASGGQTSSLSGDIISANYDAGTQIFTVSALGLSAQLNRFGTADYGRMLAMRDATGIHNAYLAEGAGAKVVIYSGGTAGNVQNLASFGRIGATELPLVGSAQFNGDYAGFTTTRRVNGKARLDVDFAAATVGGQITDRIFRQRPDNVADVVNPLSTLILEQTSLGTDGTFSGVTAGGQIVNGQILWNPASGSYVGLIGGASGNEAVGTVAVTHRAPSGGSFEEIGGFLATR